MCSQLLHDPVVTEVASECSRSYAQVLLRWSVQQRIGQYRILVAYRLCVLIKSKGSPIASHVGPQSSADLHLHSPQPDTSWHCETTCIAWCACLLQAFTGSHFAYLRGLTIYQPELIWIQIQTIKSPCCHLQMTGGPEQCQCVLRVCWGKWESFKFASKNTSARDGFEMSGQRIPYAWSGDRVVRWLITYQDVANMTWTCEWSMVTDVSTNRARRRLAHWLRPTCYHYAKLPPGVQVNLLPL